MKLINFKGVKELDSTTQELIKKADDAMSKYLETGNVFEDWRVFRSRVLSEIKTHGEIKDPTTFNKEAQDYMKKLWGQFHPEKDFTERASQFTYQSYEENMGECLKKYYQQAKDYKKALKAAKKAVIKDPEGTYRLDALFKKEFRDAKGMCKTLKRMNIEKFGRPLGAKIAIGAGIAGLAILGGIAVYKLFFKKDEAPADGDSKAPDNNSVAQVNDTTQTETPVMVQEEPVETEIEATTKEHSSAEVDTKVTKEESSPANVEIKPAEQDRKDSAFVIPTFSTYAPIDSIAIPVPFTTDSIPAAVIEPGEVDAVTKTVSEEPEVVVDKDAEAKLAEEKKAADKIAYAQAINKIKEVLLEDENVKNIATESYTTVKGDCFWNIAKKSLINEGIEKPSNKEINKRIALIAILNNIDDVTTYPVRVGVTFSIPSKELQAYINSNPVLCALFEEAAKYA